MKQAMGHLDNLCRVAAREYYLVPLYEGAVSTFFNNTINSD